MPRTMAVILSLDVEFISAWTTAHNEQSLVVKNYVDAQDDGNPTILGRRKIRRRPRTTTVIRSLDVEFTSADWTTTVGLPFTK